ncbi:MAG: hypothetical protein AAF307_10595 [Pseudomonadota bacterium]
MSVFLSTNPVAQPQPAAQTVTPEPAGQTAGPSGAVPPEAVQPTQQTGTEIKARDATAFAGKGAGAGGQQPESYGALRPAVPREKPIDATPGSVLSAQVAGQAPAQEPDRSDPTFMERILAAEEDPEERAQPTLILPDPIPTADVLKRMSA